MSTMLEKNLKNNLNQEEMRIAARKYGITFSEMEDKTRKFAEEHPIYKTFWFMPIPFKAIINPEKFYFCLMCNRIHQRNSKIGEKHSLCEYLTKDEFYKLSDIIYDLNRAIENLGFAKDWMLYSILKTKKEILEKTRRYDKNQKHEEDE